MNAKDIVQEQINNRGNLSTVSALSTVMVEELRSVFKGVGLMKPDGTYGEPAIYEQALPITQDDDDDELIYAPYVLVIKSDFKIEEWYGPKKAKIVLVFCSYDGGNTRSGDKDNSIMMDRVLERFGKNQQLGRFELVLPIEGAWQDKDTYPFFYGAIELNFEAPTYRTEDDLA